MSGTRYLFICNPAANTWRLEKKWDNILEKIKNYLHEDEFDTIQTQYPLDAKDIALKAMKDGYSHIVTVGGDGIANEVCNAVAESQNEEIILGILPAGTSNDSHMTYNFPNDTIASLPLLFNNHVERVGLGKITGDFGDKPHYFLDHCDTGLAALAARSAKYGTKLFKGEWKYTYYALKNLISFKSNPGTVIVDGDRYEEDFAVIATGFGTHMSGYHLWPGNTNDTHDFGLLLGFGHSRWSLLKLMLAAEKGNHLGREGVIYRRASTIEIELEKPWPYQAEGEIFTESTTSSKIEYVGDMINLVTNPSN